MKPPNRIYCRTPGHETRREAMHSGLCRQCWQKAADRGAFVGLTDPPPSPSRPKRGPKPATLTHCKHGHEWTPGTTYLTKEGYRSCRVCARERGRKRPPRRRPVSVIHRAIIVRQARQLNEIGWSRNRISDLLDCHHSTITGWLDHDRLPRYSRARAEQISTILNTAINESVRK